MGHPMMGRDAIADSGRIYREAATNRTFVNDERTVLVSIWPNGQVTVATRDEPGDTWGPPVYLAEEQ